MTLQRSFSLHLTFLRPCRLFIQVHGFLNLRRSRPYRFREPSLCPSLRNSVISKTHTELNIPTCIIQVLSFPLRNLPGFERYHWSWQIPSRWSSKLCYKFHRPKFWIRRKNDSQHVPFQFQHRPCPLCSPPSKI